MIMLYRQVRHTRWRAGGCLPKVSKVRSSRWVRTLSFAPLRGSCPAKIPLKGSSLALLPERFKQRQQCRHIGLNDAPQGVVVDAEIAVDQPITGSYDHPPGDLRMRGSNLVRDMSRRLAGEFQVAQGSIVDEPARHESGLVETIGVGEYLLGENDHVVEIEAPFPRC